MGTEWNLEGMKIMYKKSLYIYKGEFTYARGVRSMEMWDTVRVKNFIVPVFHICMSVCL